jgi:serine protease Do
MVLDAGARVVRPESVLPPWRVPASMHRLLAAALFVSCLGAPGVVRAQLQSQAQPQPQPPAVVIPDSASLSERARDVLARARGSVVQIKGFFGTNTAQAFHGTGFAVAPGGILVTNYHVVAEHVLYPDKYRMEYRTPEGATGKVTVLAIDVRHDLAVVRAEGYSAAPLALNAVVPAKGERAYSIGFPLDVGLTITEGVSNGQLEDSFGARIHYSGAINGGMSGGPALNGAMQVIGVNVSGYRFQQLVSFLVPASHVEPLIRRALERPLQSADAKKEIGTQLREHSRELLAALDGAIPTQNAAGYVLPAKLGAFVDCNAAGDPGTEAPVQTTRIDCSAKAGLYVQQGVQTGELKYSHYVLTTDRLDAWRFSQRLSTLAHASGEFGRLRHVGPFTCKTNGVRLQGFDASLMVCVRSYRRFEGLYDITMRVVSLNEPKRGFASHVDMFGVEFDAGMRFVQRYVDAMRWKP